MTGEIIKSFLVGLGFEVDDTSLAKFNKALTVATVKVTALYTATSAMAAGIVKGISDISGSFEQMGYEYRIIAPAINKALVLRNELLKAYSAAGINITKVIQNSVKLNMSLTKTKFALEAIYKSVGSKFFTLLTKQSDIFRNNIYKNMPRIQEILEQFVRVVFKAIYFLVDFGERLWRVLERIFNFFVELDKATDGWSTRILAVIAAWKLLNLSFLATPLGLILAGFTALFLLFDDFKTWQKGGESFFDWKAAEPYVLAAISVFEKLAVVVVQIAGSINSILHGDWDGLIGHLTMILNAFVGISDAIDKLVRTIGGNWINKLLDWRDNADKSILDFFTKTNTNLNANNPVGGGGPGLGTTNNNNQRNLNVNQQTSINVTGAADASQTGKAVGNQQSRVNRDLVDGLLGSYR